MPIPSYHRSPGPLLSNEPCSSSHFTKNKLSRDPCLGSLAKQSSKELLATGLSAGSLDCCQGKGSQQRLFSFRGDGCWMQSGSKLILPTYSFGSGSRYFTSESQSPQPGSCNGNSIHCYDTGGKVGGVWQVSSTCKEFGVYCWGRQGQLWQGQRQSWEFQATCSRIPHGASKLQGDHACQFVGAGWVAVVCPPS